MSQNKIIGILTTSEDYKSVIKLNSTIYNKLAKKYGKLYIINLNNLLLFNQNKKKNRSSNLNSDIKIFKPKNSLELVSFCKNKKLIAFNGLGKDINTFKIHYALSKVDMIQILMMNIGYLSNEIIINVNNINNFTSSLYFKLNRKISRYLFRIATLLNIFPKIDYYFDSSYPIINNLNNSLIKKIERKFKFLKISYFKKAKLINSRSFDDLYNFSKNYNKYLVFVDSFFDHPDRVLREGNISKKVVIDYYNKLSFFLSKLSKLYKKKVIICIHPKNTNPLLKKHLSKFLIVKHRTSEMIKNSHIVIFHESSAALDAVLLKKNIINLQSKLLGNYLSKRSLMYSRELGVFTYNLDKDENLIKKYFDKNLKKSKKNYYKYINEYLNPDGKQPGFVKIMNIINKI